MKKTGASFPASIGRYRIERMVGRGAMGVVYQGYDAQIDRAVAIKVLHEHLRDGDHAPEFLSRFKQEAKSAARCLHPNIVAVFDVGETDGMPYIVMEFVDGIELKAHLKSDIAIALPSAVDICIQVLEALHHAHGKGVIHRDIKPANIIVLDTGSVKVSDFGIARLDTSDLTGIGHMVGTPNYMAPEGLRGLVVDARSDLYSVGILFFELLTRQKFFRDVDIEQSLAVVASVPHLSRQNFKSIKPILARALQIDPNDRFHDAQEFIASLKSIDDMDLTEATRAYFPVPDSYRIQAHTDDISGSSQWSVAVLESLESSLARYIGPMAKMLIRKTSRSTHSLDELVQGLSLHIPNSVEQSEFIAASKKIGALSASVSGVASADASRAKPSMGESEISSEVQEKITRLLAYHVGPLAPRLMKKALQTAADISTLIATLAQQIPQEKERALFIEQARRLVQSQ